MKTKKLRLPRKLKKAVRTGRSKFKAVHLLGFIAGDKVHKIRVNYIVVNPSPLG